MELSAKIMSDLEGTIRFAVTHNSPYGASLNTLPTTNTWLGLAQYKFTTLGMGKDRLTNMWAWVNGHLPVNGKSVPATAQGNCVVVGDVLAACVKVL